MWKSIRVSALVLSMGWAAAGMAAERVDAWRGVKIDAGGTRVDIAPGADVSVRVPGAEIRTVARAPSRSESKRAVEVRDGRISLTGNRQTQTITCSDRGAEVWVGGASNNYVTEGDCKYISVSGTSNRVRVESVGRVDVTGSGNLIVWQHGLSGAPSPHVSSSRADARP